MEFDQRVDFYQHSMKWSNRMILGDSLQVMVSLADKEGLKGQVQMLDKRDVRALLGRSPNKADALAMAVYEMETGASIGGTSMSF